MKLLLTSAGLTNTSIAQALFDLAGKKPEDISLAFVPTAAHVEEDHSWMQEDIDNIKKAGIEDIRMVDIAQMEQREWLPIFEDCAVIWLNGGNTYYLLDWVRKSGLREELPRLLENRIYVGSSAGSIIVGQDLTVNDLFPEEQAYRLPDLSGLGYVPFTVLPHLNSPYFPEPTEEKVKQFADTVAYPVYALDDDSAVSVVDGVPRVISEGTYTIFNN